MKRFTRINFLVNDNLAPIVPGSILLRNNAFAKNFTVMGNIFTLAGIATPDGIISDGQPHKRYYLTENNVDINFDVEVGNIIRENQASISFSSRNSALIVYDQGITRVLHWGQIQALLSQFWNQNAYVNNFRNYFLVSSVLETPNAVVLYSRKNRTSVRLESRNNLPLLDIGSLVNINAGLLRSSKTVGVVKVSKKAPLLLETIRWDRSRKSFTPFIPR